MKKYLPGRDYNNLLDKRSFTHVNSKDNDLRPCQKNDFGFITIDNGLSF